MNNFFSYSARWLHNRVIEIFKNLRFNQDSNILDFWCWNGSLLNDFNKLWYKNLNWCDWFILNKNIHKIVKFQLLNFNNWVSELYKKESIDLITMIEVIEHLENPNLVCKDLHAILKKDGYLIITTPNVQTLLSRILFLFEANPYCFRKSDARTDWFPGHISPLFPHMFEKIFENYFKIENIFYWDFIIPFLGKPLPLRNKLFWHNIILVLKKI